jgi:hypothetical protein
MYGLESLQLNDSTLRRLDTFQLKGLRKILKLTTTYVDREHTNARVYELAEQALQAGGETNRGIQKLSEFYGFCKLKLFAKTVALSSNDPRSAVTFREGTMQRHNYGKRRVGRPRLNWIDETTTQFWKTAVREHMKGAYVGNLDLSNPEHVRMIRETAEEWDIKHNLTGEQNRSRAVPAAAAPDAAPAAALPMSAVVPVIAGYAPGRTNETR